MNDDLEGEELDGLQSYARKGMAQELARKLGLLADVPGADQDPQEEQPQGDVQTSAQSDIPPELLEQILAAQGR